MTSLIAQLSDAVHRTQTLESLTRPLLQMLQAVTGLESTYLTTVDLGSGQQQVLFAHNSQALQIPEGLTVPWGETLCRRALEAGRAFTDDVPGVWGDSDAARQLGLRTYVSTPVHTEDGALYGTLCAASSASRPLSEQAEQVLRLFAGLIEQQVARERLVERLHRANLELQQQALTDALTGLMNRRALMPELSRMLAVAKRTGRWLLACTIDLDGFKQINDLHGHDAGDDFLRGISGRLQAALRSDDVLARMGGDEFVVVGLGPLMSEDCGAAVTRMQQRLATATIGRYDAAAVTLDYEGASVGVACLDPRQVDAAEALRQSDAQMYRVKLERRRGAAAAR